MNTYIKETSIKSSLNKTFRTPLRNTVSKLKTGLVTNIEVFKNKQLIEVYGDIDPRFLNKI